MSVDREKIRHRWFGIPGFLRAVMLIVALLAFVLLVVAGGRAALARLQFFESGDKIMKRAQDAEMRARQFEERAVEAEKKAADLDRQLMALNARVQAADDALTAARNITVKVRQDYGAVKNRDLSTISPDVRDLCRQLERAGYGCTPVR